MTFERQEWATRWEMLGVLERMTSFALVRCRILDGHMTHHIVFCFFKYIFVYIYITVCFYYVPGIFRADKEIVMNLWLNDYLAEEVQAQGLDTSRAHRQSHSRFKIFQDISILKDKSSQDSKAPNSSTHARLALSAQPCFWVCPDSEKPPRCLFSDQMMSW